MKDFLECALDEIKPSKADEKRIEKLFRIIKETIKRNLPETQVVLGGSAAKKTLLKNNEEIDVFVRFPLKTKNISEKTLLSLKKFKPETVKGSRDYYSFKHQNLRVEVIPVYKIKEPSQAKNIMDNSPLHVEYVRKKLKHPEQAMLLKYFCRQNGLYGAESYKQGFSGYALELLTIHYGNFEKVVRHASAWKDKTIIMGDERELTKSQITSLIILDPVQKTRNASNSLSKENFRKFVELCKNYNKNPSKSFFLNKNTLKYYKSKKKELEYFYSKKFLMKGKKDIFLSKLNRELKKISKELLKLGFNNYYGLVPEENSFFFVVEKEIPKTFVHKGPKTSMKEHCKLFRNKWGSKVVEKNGRLVVEVERELTNGLKAVKKLVKQMALHI